MAKWSRRSLMPVSLALLPANCKFSRGIMSGFTAIRQERTVLLNETIELMRQHRIADPDFGSRGQTVLHDLRQFEDDLEEATALGESGAADLSLGCEEDCRKHVRMGLCPAKRDAGLKMRA
jgi:hypothetical protein